MFDFSDFVSRRRIEAPATKASSIRFVFPIPVQHPKKGGQMITRVFGYGFSGYLLTQVEEKKLLRLETIT